MLAVDDGQDLDDASAGFVHHLAGVGSAVALVTLRSGADRPGALDGGSGRTGSRSVSSWRGSPAGRRVSS